MTTEVTLKITATDATQGRLKVRKAGVDRYTGLTDREWATIRTLIAQRDYEIERAESESGFSGSKLLRSKIYWETEAQIHIILDASGSGRRLNDDDLVGAFSLEGLVVSEIDGVGLEARSFLSISNADPSILDIRSSRTQIVQTGENTYAVVSEFDASGPDSEIRKAIEIAKLKTQAWDIHERIEAIRKGDL